MRICLWHGWLLEGTGSNIYTAKVAEVWRSLGHEVILVCQQRRPERFPFVDAWAVASTEGVSDPRPTGAAPAPGSVIVVHPDIGRLLPVFVLDEYEGFETKRFVDLSEDELHEYLARNVEALRAVDGWRRPDATVAGHAVPGPVIARRALGEGRYVAKIHGSDLEYAVRIQPRYRALAVEGLEGAGAVVGASADVLSRTVEVAPSVAGRTREVPPGVDMERWRPLARGEALLDASDRLEADRSRDAGRPSDLDARVGDLLASRDAEGLDSLARSYDQTAPDPDGPARLRGLSGFDGPLVGYLGKLIPEKGVERYLQALAMLGEETRGLVVGFGLFREWLTALLRAVDGGDPGAAEWLAEYSPMDLELSPGEVEAARGLASRVSFTGRLDHHYAPEVVAAMDVLVVPSTLDEAFGMVAAEGAAAGALPVVARHSSLAEVAAALESAAGRPGMLSFEPGPGSARRLGAALRALLALPLGERDDLRKAVRDHVVSSWTWDRTAERLLRAAGEG